MNEKNSPKEFVGGTREEALAAALSYFDRPEEELTVRTLSVNEVAGLGSSTLIVALHG